MIQIDYAKLSKSNQLFFNWKNKIHDLMMQSNMKQERQLYQLGYNRNFYYYVKFFKNNTQIAAKYLGKKFVKDMPKMFFAETIENDLIVQYVPAIYSEMSKHTIPPMLWQDLYDYLLIGLRDSVWRYSREDIKFSTYAINGLRNNIRFFMSNSARERRMSKSAGILFSDMNLYEDENGSPAFEKAVVDERKDIDRLEIADTVRHIAVKANVTPQQMDAINFYIDHGYAENERCSNARRKMAKYAKQHIDELQDVLN